jgi:predicted TIM-barrel fold metal-dependent hydrolase
MAAIFDTHFHIIDFRFPVTENQGFMPPSFPVEAYRQRTAGLGIVAGVVVTGSFQNFDTTFLRDALAKFGPTFVAVAQLPADMPDAEILALDAIGVRGVRINMVRGGSAGLEDLDRIARRVYDLARWHVELYADAKDLAPVYAKLASLPAMSIAHLGLSSAGLPTLLKLVDRGMKVKATGFGRIDLDVTATIKALVAANPDCLMFGSDLPSQRARRAFEPADIELIRSALDPALERKVFFETAAGFYRPRSLPSVT